MLNSTFMKHYASLIFCFFSHVLLAQTIDVRQTDIAEVKVFFQGAEIVRHFNYSLPAGKTELKISNLSTSINPNSIVVSSGSSVKIVSLYQELDYENKWKNDARYNAVKDSIDVLQHKIQYKEMQYAALEEEKKVLLQNSVRVNHGQGLSVAEIDQTSAYVRKKQEEINGLLLQRQQEAVRFKKELVVLTEQLKKISLQDSSTVAAVYLLVESATAQKAEFRLAYYVKSCGWAPTYNIYAQGIGQPLTLDYKAHILNNSGEDWNKIKLSLLAGNPSRSLTLPIMETWVLSYNYRKKNGKVYGYNESGNEGELSKKQIKNGSAALETQEIELEEGEMLFNLEGTHSVPSGPRKYLVDTLSASYIYQTIPKIDAKAYLIAKVKDWEQLKLIEADANIFFNETFVGRTYIDPMGAGDSLEFSLGPDPAIQITRVKKKDINSRRFIGLHLVENFSYEIDVRNLNKNTVTIEVIDQVPIAQQDDIQISLEEKNGADYQTSTGKLSWKLEIPPVQTVKLKMGYSVKYPRDKIVIIKRTGKVLCPKFR
jgi:uncharacterized protein (TIGR02231 family)